MGDRQGVEVDDAVDAVGGVLHVDPVADGPEVVAEMEGAGGLDARKGAWTGLVAHTCVD